MDAPPGEELELRETTILDRRWWPALWAWRVFFVCALSGALARSPPLAGIALGALGVLWWSSERRPPLAGTPRVKLSVRREGIESGAMRLVERADVVEGTLWPSSPHGAFVQLVRRGARPPLEIATRTVDEARALLAMLELDGPRAVATFRVRSLLYARRGIALAMVASAFALLGVTVALGARGHAQSFRAALFCALLATAVGVVGAAMAAWPTTVRIGADGVLVRWGPLRRLVRFADVEEYQVFARGVRLRLRAGRPVVLRTDGGKEGEARRDALVERLQAAAAESESVDARALGRGDRDVHEWLSALRALGRKAASFRDAPLADEALWRALRDPYAAPTARAGAAIALAPRLDGEGRARVRLAAASMVSPALRVALEAAVDEVDEVDDDRLQAALSGLSDEERSGR